MNIKEREDVIKRIFGHSYVTKVSYSKTKANLERKELTNQVDIIELCFNSRKKADFEIFFKKKQAGSNSM